MTLATSQCGLYLTVDYILKSLVALPFSITVSKSKTIIQNFNFVFLSMESKHSLITFLFSTFRDKNFVRGME